MMTFFKQLFLKSRPIVLYGALMAMMVFALKWLQWKYFIADHSLAIYIGLIALLFTSLGVWVATQLSRPKTRTVIVEKAVYLPPPDAFTINEPALEKLNLTTREYEVLQLLTQGHSNAEIAEHLFLSLSTVKTHVSNLLLKMEVKNRTQAAEKAKRLRITL